MLPNNLTHYTDQVFEYAWENPGDITPEVKQALHDLAVALDDNHQMSDAEAAELNDWFGKEL